MIAKVLLVLAVLGTPALSAPNDARRSRAIPTLAAREDHFDGQATYYEVGLGSCGGTNGDGDMIVALNNPQYEENGGTPSGGGPCGRQVSITDKKTGKTMTATVADRCPGCQHGDLDMSPALFGALHDGDMGAGRFDISWSFQ